MPQRTQTTAVRDAIAKGTLFFEQKGASIRFKLISEEVIVFGLLNIRHDWTNGAPGVMPVINRVDFSSGDSIAPTFLQENTEQTACWYYFLENRLAPEKIFEFCEQSGWKITSFNSKPLKVKDVDLLCSHLA